MNSLSLCVRVGFSNHRLLPLLLIALVTCADAWEADGEARYLAGSDSSVFMRPQWSPDGQFLAFTGPQHRGLWVLNTTDSSTQKLTDAHAAGFAFRWSPDSRYLLTRTARYEDRRRKQAIVIIEVSSGNSRNMSGYQVQRYGMPRWSPNQMYVYFDENQTLQTMYTGLREFREPQALISAIFLRSHKIIISNLSGGELQSIDPLPGKRLLNLEVSPNGRYAAFEVVGGHLHVIDLQTSELTDLGIGYRAAWSPDSEFLVYMISEDDGHRYQSSDLYTIHRKGGKKKALTQSSDRLEMNPSWSPDGKQIAFDDPLTGSLYLLNIVPEEDQ